MRKQGWRVVENDHLNIRAPQGRAAAMVAAYIGAAYWFTASTSFANPAVTLARAFSDSFAGIRPIDAPGFIAAQIVGGALAVGTLRWLLPRSSVRRPPGTN
jgi:glycerol uptake facilitator-like aquaporin